MSGIGLLVTVVVAGACVYVYRRRPSLLEFLPPHLRGAVAGTTAVLVGLGCGALTAGDWRLAVFVGLGVILLLAGLWVQEREDDAAPRRGGTPVPDLDRERPAYIPSWWPNDASTRHLAASPWNALAWYGPWLVVSIALISWRIVGGDSMTETLGDPWDTTLLVVSIVALGFNWVYGMRAIDALRADRRSRR